jgi:hypothetical protein
VKEIDKGDITVLGNLLRDIARLAENPDVGGVDEYICRLFDDDRIEEFARSLAGYYGLNEFAVAQLRAFCSAVAEYSRSLPNGIGEAEVVTDPRWATIRQLAKAVVHASESWK